jgi:uncharacterized protein YyaL (SSP411 family)
MSNKLEKENNLIHWYPWCDEALKKAQKENKAIFISIGYSSCHWCRVMDEEVFQNKECIDILNEYFVCIKVDKEERPDIDKYYQKVHELLNRRVGGSPMSIFATPQNKPFFAGTYIPLESEQGSIEGMGFIELTKLIGTKIKANDEQIYKNADEVEEFLNNPQHPKEATVLSESFTKNYMLQVKNNYETKFGGFSSYPKFPQVATLSALMSIDKLYDDKAAKAMVLHTLKSMKAGGFYDLVDGGFFRYSTDIEWRVPHFEKVLYDNALLCKIYVDAYMAYKDESFLQTAKEIADFWYDFMSEDGLFYSASDADNSSKDGFYFTYTYDEVYDILEKNGYKNIDALLFELGVSKDGDFHGRNIIRPSKNISPELFKELKPPLQKLRNTKTYPFINQNIQTSYSSMMIDALFQLGKVDSTYKQKAIKSLDALLDTMMIDSKLYHATFINKKPRIEAFLEDYAYLSQALISAFEATKDEIYLVDAQRFINLALEKFFKNGSWRFSDNEFEIKADAYDNTYISSISIMIENLLNISALLKDDKYKHFAFKTLEYNSYELGRRPVLYPYMLKMMLRYLKENQTKSMI